MVLADCVSPAQVYVRLFKPDGALCRCLHIRGAYCPEPKLPLQKYDPSGKNDWFLNVTKTDSGWSNKQFKSISKKFHGKGDFSPNLSVLGKLTSVLIAPTNFGAGNKNMLTVFLKTEQQVGTMTQKKSRDLG